MHNRLLPQVLRNQFDLLARRVTFALSLSLSLFHALFSLHQQITSASHTKDT